MTTIPISIDQLKEYVDVSFLYDYEIVYFFDPRFNIQKWEDAARIVYDKIVSDYSECKIKGVEINGNKAGYLVYNDNLLISFGLNKEYRNEKELQSFWGIIIKEVGEFFQCVLFSKNTRAIRWLRKCGMDALLESVTILETSKN